MSALLSKTHQMARNENDQQMTRVEVFSKRVLLKDKETEILIKIGYLCVSRKFVRATFTFQKESNML